MCYHTKIKATAGELELHYHTKSTHEVSILEKDYHTGFDYPELPIMTPDNGLMMGHWGILPDYVRTPEQIKAYRAKAYGGLNAKVENLDTVWANFEENRCLVPVTSFREWRHEEVPGKKTPKKIPFDVVTHSEISSIAGIYNDWTSPEGETIRTYAIVTTEANKPMEYIHNSKKRMPMFVSRERERDWLDGAPADGFANQDSTRILSFEVRD